MSEPNDREQMLAALRRMSLAELYEVEERIRTEQLTLGTRALLEAAKAGVWLQGMGTASGLVIGLNVAQWLPGWAMIAISVGVLIGVAIAFAGAMWHRRRGIARLAEGRALDAMRAALGQEINRRCPFAPEDDD